MEKQTNVVVIVYYTDCSSKSFYNVCKLTTNAIYYKNDKEVIFKHSINQEYIKQLIVL